MTRRPELLKILYEFKIPYTLGKGWCRRTRAAAKTMLSDVKYIEFMKRAGWESII